MKSTFTVQNIEKTLNQRLILNNISLTMESGKTYGIIGPNSAGKTTLTKVLSGSLQPEKGMVSFNGQAVERLNVKEHIRRGICAIYNDRVTLVNMRVKDYLMLSLATNNNPFCIADMKIIEEKIQALFNRYSLDVDLNTAMKNFSLSNQKLIEFFMTMLCQPKVLILDELDAWFEGKLKTLFFEIVRDLSANGCIVIVISHELPTIIEVCDSISIVKDGCIVSTQPVAGMTPEKLIDDFFAHERLDIPRRTERCGVEVLNVEHLNGVGLKDISFSIREGDVVGLSGNRGAARTSLAKTLMGEEKYQGTIYIRGQKVLIDSPKTAVQNGIAYITHDISSEALFPGLSILQNMLPRFMQHVGNKKQQNEIVEHYIELLKIKDGEPDKKVDELSSGAQKKIVIARWLLCKSDIFIFERLSQNLDILAIMDIFSIILELRRMGKSIILISDHTKELLALCNVIHIFSNKSISKTLYGQNINKKKITISFNW